MCVCLSVYLFLCLCVCVRVFVCLCVNFSTAGSNIQVQCSKSKQNKTSDNQTRCHTTPEQHFTRFIILALCQIFPVIIGMKSICTLFPSIIGMKWDEMPTEKNFQNQNRDGVPNGIIPLPGSDPMLFPVITHIYSHIDRSGIAW